MYYFIFLSCWLYVMYKFSEDMLCDQTGTCKETSAASRNNRHASMLYSILCWCFSWLFHVWYMNIHMSITCDHTYIAVLILLGSWLWLSSSLIIISSASSTSLTCLPYLQCTILPILFVPLLSCFSAIQRFPTKSNFDSRTFWAAAPSVWNSLPYPVRASRTLASFKRALKTYYFQSSFHPSLY